MISAAGCGAECGDFRRRCHCESGPSNSPDFPVIFVFSGSELHIDAGTTSLESESVWEFGISELRSRLLCSAKPLGAKGPTYTFQVKARSRLSRRSFSSDETWLRDEVWECGFVVGVRPRCFSISCRMRPSKNKQSSRFPLSFEMCRAREHAAMYLSRLFVFGNPIHGEFRRYRTKGLGSGCVGWQRTTVVPSIAVDGPMANIVAAYLSYDWGDMSSGESSKILLQMKAPALVRARSSSSCWSPSVVVVSSSHALR